LNASGERLLALVDSCRAPRGPALRIRHHGDYHLGQVLVANNDFFIIDFEGEPSRPLEESRRKHSPLRDVAGMLRSFSYAKWTATKSSSLDKWESETRRAFLSAYDAATQGSGLFESFDDVRGLLKLFELEKVLYELRYEFNNRPDWLQVPLAGIKAMLEEGG
jgi:maltose alpha-D-glucosyltransferase/alpha-amylase